jgi:hypothetical protein
MLSLIRDSINLKGAFFVAYPPIPLLAPAPNTIFFFCTS